MELGVQSYCLRGIKNVDAVSEAVRECGLRKIELCAVHADFSHPDEFAELAEVYGSNGVSVVSIGVNRIDPDEAAARLLFECARVAGLKRMSVDFPLEGVDEACRIADGLSEEYGILLGIHNHGGRHWLGSSTALRWVFAKTSERIGLSLDTAWAIDAREDPVEGRDAVGGDEQPMPGMDASIDGIGDPDLSVTSIGEREVDLEEWFGRRHRIGSSGRTGRGRPARTVSPVLTVSQRA